MISIFFTVSFCASSFHRSLHTPSANPLSPSTQRYRSQDARARAKLRREEQVREDHAARAGEQRDRTGVLQELRVRDCLHHLRVLRAHLAVRPMRSPDDPSHHVHVVAASVQLLDCPPVIPAYLRHFLGILVKVLLF